MAQVQQYELLHGVVLTKLTRNARPYTLRLIETSNAAWSAYKINDVVSLYVKSSASFRDLLKNSEVRLWQFTFTASDISHLNEPETYVALVCGASSLDDKEMQVCFLKPQELAQVIDLKSTTRQWIRVEYAPRKSLRVHGSSTKEPLIVNRNGLDTWEVPGS